MAKKRPTPETAAEAAEQISVTVSCPVHKSFRVQQMTGMFDVPITERVTETFDVELPRDEEPWQIGVVVGPSGSGKSTVSNHRWRDSIYQPTPEQWPADPAVIDCFEGTDVKDLTAMLTSVGFSSPPSWIKPYHVLSNGEKFRCDLARSLLCAGDSRLVVFDEFTSVVDRTVAKIGSAAVSKAVRRREGLRFVAVSCHYDIVEWLEPDWVLDMQTRSLARRRLRRPSIELEIHQASRSAWSLFKKAHYLSGGIPAAASIFIATWHGEPVACVVGANFFGRSKAGPKFAGERRISRIVVLPDFQGVGIGRAFVAAVAEMYAAQNLNVRIVTGHPSMVAILKSDPRWHVWRYSPYGNVAITKGSADSAGEFRPSFGRGLVSAVWRPAAAK